MTEKQLIRLLMDSLRECDVHPEHFDFGPSYSLAVDRREAALRAARKYLKETP